MRISRHQAFMETARIWARRSTCFRGNVGAVVVCQNSIIAIGYNGPPSGHDHCYGLNCGTPQLGCTRSIHAEINALTRVPTPLKDEPLELYVTDSPCPHCFDFINTYRIQALYYHSLYRIHEHLLGANFPIYRLMPNGYVIDHNTGELMP